LPKKAAAISIIPSKKMLRPVAPPAINAPAANSNESPGKNGGNYKACFSKNYGK